VSKIHVYIKPFANDQGTGYADEWIEVTDDVTDLGNLTQALDNTQYDVGVFRASNMKLSLSNHDGRYSDVDKVESIFKYKRGDSLVRLSWEPGDGPLVAGFFVAGAPGSIVSEEVVVFEGVLSDLATQSDIDDVDVDFQVLGFESMLAEMLVPFADVANGDTFAEIILACLDQVPFNALVTVSAGNITTGTVVAIDDKSSLETRTVLEALKQILIAANSVLYIRDGAVHVGPRTASDDLAFTFYGPGSLVGIPNIVDIDKYRTGLNRVFNYWTWRDTVVLAEDATSNQKYGTQPKEVSVDVVTDAAKKLAIVTALNDEFKNPKREMDLDAFITPATLELFLLDKIAIDYPSVALPVESRRTAQYEVSPYDRDYYADELLPLTIESTARFKVMTRIVDWKNETLKFSLREI
jgi:hypothetical protein